MPKDNIRTAVPMELKSGGWGAESEFHIPVGDIVLLEVIPRKGKAWRHEYISVWTDGDRTVLEKFKSYARLAEHNFPYCYCDYPRNVSGEEWCGTCGGQLTRRQQGAPSLF